MGSPFNEAGELISPRHRCLLRQDFDRSPLPIVKRGRFVKGLKSNSGFPSRCEEPSFLHFCFGCNYSEQVGAFLAEVLSKHQQAKKWLIEPKILGMYVSNRDLESGPHDIYSTGLSSLILKETGEDSSVDLKTYLCGRVPCLGYLSRDRHPFGAQTKRSPG